MAISVPQMQQRFTGYDFGQNTARNLLDAVRMKNQKEQFDRDFGLREDALSLRKDAQKALIDSQKKADNIASAKEARALETYNIDTATAKAISEQAKTNLLNEKKIDEAQKRMNQIQAGGGSFLNQLLTGSYNVLQPFYEGVDNFTLGLIDGNLGTPEERSAKDSGYNREVNTANNQFYNIFRDPDPNVVLPNSYIEQTRLQDPNNLLNQVMINSNY